jgi:hypothetical protein
MRRWVGRSNSKGLAAKNMVWVASPQRIMWELVDDLARKLKFKDVDVGLGCIISAEWKAA